MWNRLGRLRHSTLPLVLLVAAAWTSAYSWAVRLPGIFAPFNDQYGYITVARNLATTGEMTASIIYPSFLLYPKNFAYMPGYYIELAGVFKLLGFGTFQALLPSRLSLVLAAVAAFLLARKLYGPGVGWLAALLTLTLPAHLLYSQLAQTEMACTAAVIGALAIFVLSPAKSMSFIGPLLVAGAVLIRETNALRGSSHGSAPVRTHASGGRSTADTHIPPCISGLNAWAADIERGGRWPTSPASNRGLRRNLRRHLHRRVCSPVPSPDAC